MVWTFSNIARLKPRTEEPSERFHKLIKVLVESFVHTENQSIREDCVFGFYQSIDSTTESLFEPSEFLSCFRDYLERLIGTSCMDKHKVSAALCVLGNLTSLSGRFS